MLTLLSTHSLWLADVALGLQVTFTASVAPTVGSVLLGPSDGVVLFSVAGSTALSYVQKSILGSAMVARSNSVAGTAQLTVERSSKGLLLLPGALKPCAPLLHQQEGAMPCVPSGTALWDAPKATLRPAVLACHKHAADLMQLACRRTHLAAQCIYLTSVTPM